MHSTTKARGSPKESPHKVSAGPARQLKISPVKRSSPSSSNQAAARTPKDRSPKVVERKSPRSPLSDKKRPSKLSELESQITKLQEDLKKVKDQLVISETSKREAQEDAEQAKKELADVSLKLEESLNQVTTLVASKEADVLELQNISQQNDQEWESRIKFAHVQHSDESDALNSAYDEIQMLEQQVEPIATPQSALKGDSKHDELLSLKNDLEETLSLVESMKDELKNSRDSEAQAQDLVKETLLQLEAAKETVNALRSDVIRSTEAYNSIASELEQSRARVNSLEGIVSKMNLDLKKTDTDNVLYPICDQRSKEDVNQLEMELQAMKSDVGQLKSALEATDVRLQEEQSLSKEHIRNVTELLEQIEAKSSLREAEVEAELKKACITIEELKANLMDKETELQGISEENESLNMKLGSMSSQREHELEHELRELRKHVADMKGNVMYKETELQNILEENEMLKLEIKKQEAAKGVEDDQVATDVEASRAAERDAMSKLGYLMEEVDHSQRKAARIAKQLEAAQAANVEMEAELRKLKVQSDQWRKAAEAAASMLSPVSNGKFVERTGSMPLDNNYSPMVGNFSSPYLDDYDDDSFKKKNGNVLKKIGVLWKKPQK